MRAVNRDPTHRKTKTNKYQPVHGWRPRCTDAPPQLELLSQDRPIGIAPRSRMSPACRCSTRPALERSPRSPKLSVFYDSAGQGNGEGSDLKDPALRVKSVIPTPPPKKKVTHGSRGFRGPMLHILTGRAPPLHEPTYNIPFLLLLPRSFYLSAFHIGTLCRTWPTNKKSAKAAPCRKIKPHHH